MSPLIYVDLDNTLANFELKFFQLTGKRVHEVDSEYLWGAITAYDDAGGQWFADLPLMPDAMQLWEYVKPHNAKILTATGREEEKASRQKRIWTAAVLGIEDDSRVITVRKSEFKALHASPGAILIDDHLERSIKPWIAAGGIGIHHTHAALSIAVLKSLGI